MKLSATGILAIVAAVGVVVLYKKKDSLANDVKDFFTPKSMQEKQVDVLYGPGQGWKTAPVYNTPGTPQYLPTLPASYAPGTAESDMPIPPGAIEVIYLRTLRTITAPSVFPPAGSYYDLGAKPVSVDQAAGQSALDTVAPFMYGLGNLEFDAGRRPRLYFHNLRIR